MNPGISLNQITSLEIRDQINYLKDQISDSEQAFEELANRLNDLVSHEIEVSQSGENKECALRTALGQEIKGIAVRIKHLTININTLKSRLQI